MNLDLIKSAEWLTAFPFTGHAPANLQTASPSKNLELK
jgi:hypothetical protein